MKIKTFVLMACFVIPYQFVSADPAADLASGMSVAAVIAKAESEGISIEDAVENMINANPAEAATIVSAAITASPQSAGAIVSVAVRAVPAAAAAIVSAATAAAPGSATVISTAAIGAGADPAVVTQATAAGNTIAQQTQTQPQTQIRTRTQIRTQTQPVVTPPAPNVGSPS